ncbi:hypothetical protein B0H67DRAFT_466655, partial [Lasiosphaeris hirsuta]
RSFSAAAALDTTLLSAQDLFTGLHSLTGTPWFITIPLIALSINLVARLPLTIYTRGIAQRRAELAPLFRAWSARHTKDVVLNPQVSQRLTGDALVKEVEARFKKTSKRLFKTFGVQRWRDYTGLAVFPVWLLGIEALRRLCGGPRGFIGTLVLGPTNAQPQDGAADAVAASSNPTDAISITDVAQVVTPDLGPAGADFSLANGGCLWFPDLMMADPLHILPFALSAILVANVLPRTQSGYRALLGMDDATNKLGLTEGRRRLTRVFLIMAFAIGPVTMNLPAALHLYWISSSTITFIQTWLVNWFKPLPEVTVRPCKGSESLVIRPTR